MSIPITQEMINIAHEEAAKRDPYIKHHFQVDHLTGEERDMIGFLGEFACCALFGIDWKSNIRFDYLTIDSGDISKDNVVFDVKTETIPGDYLKRILERTIGDDELYGRRLINEKQVPLLSKYAIVIFGAFKRDDYNQWYPLGYLETDYILAHYEVTRNRPDGGLYPFSGLPVRTSDLKHINGLKHI